MAATKRNPNIKVEVVSKRIVRLGADELIMIAKDNKVYVSTQGDEDEEYMAEFPREDFLDAVLGLYPENVAYSFTQDDE